MDVPRVRYVVGDRARVFGSLTARNILAGDPDMAAVVADRFLVLDDQTGDRHHEGSWDEVAPGIRMMALRSGHTAHFWGIRMYTGNVITPGTAPPKRACDWLEGPVSAFLIDLVDEAGRTAIRLHVQDAASRPPLGFPSRALDSRHVDVAVVCVGGAEKIIEYPGDLLKVIRPRMVLLTHWEDFFRSPARRPRVVRGSDLSKFVTAVDQWPWVLPRPGVAVRLHACPMAPPTGAVY